jgi:hypothetical protein
MLLMLGVEYSGLDRLSINLTSATDAVNHSCSVILNGSVAITLNINSLSIRDSSPSVASSAPTSLRIADTSSVILVSAVAIASDNCTLIAVNRGCGVASMSGKR